MSYVAGEFEMQTVFKGTVASFPSTYFYVHFRIF